MKKQVKLLLSLMLVLALCLTFTATALADKGDVPDHQKTVTPQTDGTYQIELTVKGDADTTVQTAANVNVLIVYDESQSMVGNNVSGNRTRADYTEDVMHDFIANLARYQTGDGSNIEVALVGFGPTATTRQGWTSDLTGGNNGVNRFFDDGVDGETFNGHGYDSNYGTNWEASLQEAQTLLNQLAARNDTDPTFVILVTDGVCTASGDGSNAISPNTGMFNPQPRPWNDFVPYYNEARNEARAIQTLENTTLLGIYAYGDEADLLDDLIYYSNTGSDRSGMNGDTVVNTENYYNASNTASLNAAIEDIFGKIVEALGISTVAMSDSTTQNVQSSTGFVDLVEVDESSYQYWLKVPIDSSNQFKRIDLVSGDEITYTVSSDGKTVTWPTNNSVTVNGEIVSEGGQRYLKYEWTEANALYNKAPTEAHFNTTTHSVDWDLSSAGTLLDGVIYSITFTVYPTQTTLDYIADIKNNPSAWNELGDVKNYIDQNGKLATNTGATLTYSDTRLPEDDQPDPVSFEPPEKQQAEAVETLAVTKDWKNALDDRPKEDVELEVNRDNESDVYDLVLNQGNNWRGSVYISIGIMRTEGLDEPEILAPGHDFTLSEPQNLSYRWELDAPVMRPMLIDGVKTMLIKVDTKHPAPSGAATYNIGGAQYYAGQTGDASLTATNNRRSNLNFTKVVTGEGAPEDAVFPFTMTVVNSEAPASEPTNDPDHASDYWVWVSVFEGNNPVTEEGVVSGEGVVNNGGGYYYAPSGTAFTINVKEGYNVRANNLPSGSTYTITEGSLPPAFAFDNVAGERQYRTYSGEGDTTGTPATETTGTASGKSISGTIAEPNSTYQATFTNKYELTDVTVTKAWADNDDELKVRPDTLELTLNNLPSGVTAPTPTVTKGEGNNSNTWTYTWSNVPKYGDGEVINYTVTEGTVPEGYTCETKTANADGTITNTLATANLTIRKSASGATVPAATTFTVTGPNGYTGSVKYSQFTNGAYTFEDVPIGNYTVVESDAEVGGYTLTTTYNPAAQGEGAQGGAVKVTENGGEITVTNTYTRDKGSLKISKVFVEKPANINAITFTVTGPEGYNETFNYADFADGSKTIPNLPTGDYTVTESGGTATGYTLTTDYSPATTPTEEGAPVTSATQTVSKNATTEVTVTNTYTRDTGNLTITKTFSGITADLIPENFTVTVTADGAQTAAYTLTKNSEGFTADGLTYTWTLTGVQTGDYDIAEQNATVTNYSPITADSKTEDEATVTKGGSATATLTNAYSRDTGNLTITKSATGLGQSAVVPAGTTFTITASPSDYTGKTKFTYEDFTDGTLTLSNVPTGTYKVEEDTETANVSGYTLNSTTYASSDNKTDGSVEVTKADPDAATQQAATVNITNAYAIKPGTLIVVKTAEPSEGAKLGDTITFTITITNNNEYDVTDIEVEDPLTGATWQIEKLAAGATSEPLTTTYKVTKEDVDAGKVHNVVTAKGEDPTGGDVPGQGEVDVPTGKDPAKDHYWLYYVSNGGTEYDPELYPEGQVVNITYEPIRPGYTFEGWYSDPELTKPVSRVTMNQNHTVYAKWSKTPVPGWLDGDNHIAYLIGYPDGLIQPHWNITRAEVATIFFRLLKEEVRQEYLTSDNTFGDVVEGQWFNTAISTVSSMGIVKGYPDGDFHPNANITRAEFAAIAARFDQLTETNGTYFSDIDGHWAKREICLAAHKGWITGYPDGTFRPNNLATRAEVAALINRVLNRDPESPEDLLEGMVEWPDNMDTGAWYYLDLQESSNTHEYERETKPTEKWTVLLENPDWTIYNH